MLLAPDGTRYATENEKAASSLKARFVCVNISTIGRTAAIMACPFEYISIISLLNCSQ